ncbi:MAG: DNA translocase FtsK [Streptococcaceae bacterium]|nr:DNA translocase FtsK [Streptococcaceae bacterium]
MVLYVVSLVLLFFAYSRLGFFGVLLYNLVRLVVGSTALVALTLYLAFLLLRLVKNYIFQENHRLIPGILTVYAGVILIVQAIFADKFGNDTALWNVLEDFGNFEVTKNAAGGFIGWLLYFPSKALFSSVGVYIIAAIIIFAGVFIAVPGLVNKLASYFRKTVAGLMESREERKQAKVEQEQAEAEANALNEALQEQNQNEEDFNDFEDAPQGFDRVVPIEDRIYSQPVAEALNFDNYQYQEPLRSPLGMMTDKQADWHDVYPEERETSDDENAAYLPEYSDLAEVNSDAEHSYETSAGRYSGFSAPHKSFYQLPTTQLLTEVPPKNQTREREQVKKNIVILEETFKSFGINASVETAVVGPSVTKYEIKLATGVRVNRVANLSDDLALALSATDVRIEAPIPGKPLVGIEIPNLEIATVGFREMWDEAKTDPSKLLEIPLGKALDGSIKTFDLTRMPHLLIAGSTGSGKSVAVNGIIASILMKSLPSQVKFLMVDPKMVELSVYNDIPQLLIPVVTNPRKASRALQRVVDEMERRYELFSHVGVRNMAGYNAKIEKNNANSDEKDIPLPFIVVIVDELADLMMVASKEVEDAIIRLGQKARAAGIHMILATQRPSVDVISGLIKANVPSRVAFAVSSGTDSRTILDGNGAEKLLGRGDMLFKPIDANHPVRLQGAFLSDDDVETLVDFIKGQTEPDYDDSFDPGEEAADDNRAGYAGSNDSSDPLFEEAKSLVITSQKASTAQLQRLLKVGFNRATDLMNELEAAGIVGPAKGTTPRKVLMNLSGDYSGSDE